MGLGVMAVRFDEELLEGCQARSAASKPGMSSELARIDVDFTDEAAASAFLLATLSEELGPCVMGRWCVLNERPKSIVVMQGDHRNAEDIFCHGGPRAGESAHRIECAFPGDLILIISGR